MSNPIYLPTEKEWAPLLKRLLQSRRAGLDTEFDGVNFDSKLETTQHRAQVHVWSIALPNGESSPRGYSLCDSWVLPGSALGFFRPWLESGAHAKYCHHAPAEQHSIFNSAKIWCNGLVDTLSWARWALPERHPMPGFALKPLVLQVLGREPLGSYADLFSEPIWESKPYTRCKCGEAGCRKRKLPDHEKFKFEERVSRKSRLVDLQAIVPGHELWDLLVKYSGEDAEYAYQLADYLREKVVARKLEPRNPQIPI